MDKGLGLGRGLSALMGDDDIVQTPVRLDTENKSNVVLYKEMSQIVPGIFQPRRVFATEALADLVVSIKEKGVLQPLLVRKNPRQPETFEIIAGERRFRASKMAGLTRVPVIIKDFSDKEALEVAIIENLQREDLNPLEEAEAYKRLLKEFDYTQDDLSRVLGKSRSHLANMMRLLELPPEVKLMLEKKELTVGHARALLTAENPVSLACEVVKKGLSVRQTEKLASEKNKKTSPVVQEKSAHISSLETQISQLLKTKISINWKANSGKLVVNCQSLEQLDVILQRLSVGGAVS
ncbi:MAG: ParB/RepB/Spo0J family partition protein [Alphaproteobacteria bacterium]|nr:ParB/RepB/Spo0J family partition protein [Alphaproteobacteria bacterium]